MIKLRLKKIKRNEERLFQEDSDEASESSDEYDDSFINEDDCSDDNENLSASINSSDLESVDSHSDSESFKDIVNMLNLQFKRRMNRLIKYLKKKIEARDSENEENSDKDDDQNIEDSFLAVIKNFKKRLDSKNNGIKQESDEPKQK